MKYSVALIAAGLMLFTGVMAFAHGNEISTQINFSGDIEIANPIRDDLGEDDIMYDDRNPTNLFGSQRQYEGYWSKVRFTPIGEFALHAVMVLPLNQGPNNNAHLYTRVYSLDDDGDLDEMLVELIEEDVPELEFNNPENSFVTYEFDHDEMLVFDADEDFVVMYYAPSGPYNGQFGNNEGWWNFLDGTDNTGRSSFIGASSNANNNGEPDNPNSNLGQWQDAGGDLMIRVNGEYLEDFFDLEIKEVYTENGLFLTTPGTEQLFMVDIQNNADAVDFSVLYFTVKDDEGEVVWEEDIIIDVVEQEDEVTITATEPWVTPETLGNYYLEVRVDVDGDANLENNQRGLEQIVFNPVIEDGEFDQWLTYIVDDENLRRNQWNESAGWATAFRHPGGNKGLRMDAFRVKIFNNLDEAMDLEFAVHAIDSENDVEDAPRWEGIAEIPAAGDNGHWIEIDLSDWGTDEESDGNVVFEGEAFLVTYFFTEGTALLIDGDDPWAGTNREMHEVMWVTRDDGGTYDLSGVGDYPIEAKLSETDASPPGPHLSITPEKLIFDPSNFGGEELEAGQEYVIEAQFESFGDETLEISEILIAGEAPDYFTVDPIRNIDIEPGQTITVTVTFQCEEDDLDAFGHFELFSRFIVRNNMEDRVKRNWVWEFEVIVGPLSVNENVLPGVPDQFSLAQNHPNPFNPTTTIDFALAKSGVVNFTLYDMNGRMVQEVINNDMPAGYHSVIIDGHQLAAGVYMYQLTTEGFVSAHKMVLIK